MDNRISEIRHKIRALRAAMLESEALMHAQIARDEECSAAAHEVLRMRAEMGRLARERAMLGDTETIVVTASFIPRRPPAARPLPSAPAKRRLHPREAEPCRSR